MGSLFDPVARFNEKTVALRTQDEELKRKATLQILDQDPDYAGTASDEDFSKRIDDLAAEFRSQLGKSAERGPATLGNMPTLANTGPLEFAKQNIDPRSGIGARVIGSAMGMMDEENRPNDVFDLTDTTAIKDLATTGRADLSDIGNTAQVLGPALLSAIPQLRAGKGITKAAPHLQSIGLSTLGALGIGSSQEVLDRASALIGASEGNMPTLEALRQGAEDTSFEAMAMRGVGEALFEAGSSTAVFAPQAARTALAKLLGVGTEEASLMVKEAAQFKIDLAVRDVSSIQFVRKMGDILGKFPSANSIFAKGTDRASTQASKAMNDVLGDMAPTITEIIAATEGRTESAQILESNFKLLNQSRGAVRTWKDGSNNLYDRFFSAAKSGPIPASVGMAQTRLTSATERQRIRVGIKKIVVENTGLVDAAGKSIKKTVKKPPKLTGAYKKVDNFLTELVEAEPTPTVENFVGSTRKLNDLIQEVGPNTNIGKSLVKVKKSMEFDFDQNLIGSPELKALKKKADEHFAEGMTLFSGQAGKRLKRIDKNFGRVSTGDAVAGEGIRNSGTRSADNVIDDMFDSKDPAVISNLYDIVTRYDKQAGKDNFRNAYGVWLERQVRDASHVPKGGNVKLTDTSKLRRSLGLDNISSREFRATEEAFKRSGANVHDFSKLLDVMDRQFEFGIPDISSMISRRMLLGGIGSGLRTFAPLAGKGGGDSAFAFVQAVSKSAAFWIASRGISKRIADPRYLKAYRTLLDPKRGTSVRLEAARRLLVLDESFLVFEGMTGVSPRNAVGSAGDFASGMLAPREEQGGPIYSPLPDQNSGAGVR